MTGPAIEDKVNAELRHTAERVARNMRDLLMTANRTNQRRWEGKRAEDRVVRPQVRAEDRVGELAAGWMIAHRNRENDPQTAQQWDSYVKNNGIDPQRLYVTMTNQEESMQLRADAEKVAAQARIEQQQAQAERQSAEQERTQAAQANAPTTVFDAVVPAAVTAYAVHELAEITDTQLDTAVNKQLTLADIVQVKGSHHRGAESESPEPVMFKHDLGTAMENYSSMDRESIFEQPVAPPTRELPGLEMGM